MSEELKKKKERNTIGLRIFSEGKELWLETERRVDKIEGTNHWIQETSCPHCKKHMTIHKWISKWRLLKIR